MKRNPFLYALSLPLVLLAWLIFGLFAVVATLAILVGQKQASDSIHKLKEIL